MNKKRLVAILALPVATVLMFVGIQSTAGAFAATGIDSEAIPDATTSASADSLLQCGWRISGVASSIVLANTDPTLEYIGSDYVLAGSDSDIKVYLSGDASEQTRCSFYNDYKGAQVKVSWDGTEFTSSTTDDPSDGSLSWGVSTKPLNIAYTDADCTPDWTTQSDLSIASAFIAGSEIVPAKIVNSAVDTEYNPSAKTSPSFPACGFSASYETTIPSGKTPNHPGKSYSFSGPSLTTTLVLEP